MLCGRRRNESSSSVPCHQRLRYGVTLLRTRKPTIRPQCLQARGGATAAFEHRVANQLMLLKSDDDRAVKRHQRSPTTRASANRASSRCQSSLFRPFVDRTPRGTDRLRRARVRKGRGRNPPASHRACRKGEGTQDGSVRGLHVLSLRQSSAVFGSTSVKMNRTHRPARPMRDLPSAR